MLSVLSYTKENRAANPRFAFIATSCRISFYIALPIHTNEPMLSEADVHAMLRFSRFEISSSTTFPSGESHSPRAAASTTSQRTGHQTAGTRRCCRSAARAPPPPRISRIMTAAALSVRRRGQVRFRHPRQRCVPCWLAGTCAAFVGSHRYSSSWGGG
jgi:hypothetical protein